MDNDKRIMLIIICLVGGTIVLVTCCIDMIYKNKIDLIGIWGGLICYVVAYKAYKDKQTDTNEDIKYIDKLNNRKSLVITILRSGFFSVFMIDIILCFIYDIPNKIQWILFTIIVGFLTGFGVICYAFRFKENYLIDQERETKSEH